jgi:hypothetical protein
VYHHPRWKYNIMHVTGEYVNAMILLLIFFFFFFLLITHFIRRFNNVVGKILT